MQDERNIPQDEDAEEVEAHRKANRSPEAEDDDEVEAHQHRPAPEQHRPEPSR